MNKNTPYFQKFKGFRKHPKHPFSIHEMILSWSGCFMTILLISIIDRLSHQLFIDQPLFVAPVGASAVMIFGIPTSEYAQPRNVIGGHFFSALCGVSACYILSETSIFAGAIAVALAMAVMYATNTIHPPGGATALMAIIGNKAITDLGYSYAFVPCLSNAIILVLCGVLINNLSPKRFYPKYWY